MSKLNPVRHGRLVVHVPAGWRDETTVNFIGPMIELSGQGPYDTAEKSRCTFAVSVEELPTGIANAHEFLKALGEGLTAAGAALRDVSVEAFELGGHKGAIADREVTLPDGKIRQLTAAAIVGKNVVMATAAADAAVFDGQRAALVEMLQKVQVE